MSRSTSSEPALGPRARRALAGIGAAICLMVQLVSGGAWGSDGPRIALNEGDRAAWAAVGRLQTGTTGHCTATLIAPDVLLTAAHCLFAPETGRPWLATRLQFRPGWWSGEGRLILHGWAVDVAEEYVFDEQGRPPLGDMALVRLSGAVPEALAPFPPATEPARSGERVAVLSYGRDRPDIPSIEPRCRILQRSGALLLTDCEALPGVSGAPLLRLTGGAVEVIGVVSSRIGPEDAASGPALAVAIDAYLPALEAQLAPRR